MTPVWRWTPRTGWTPAAKPPAWWGRWVALHVWDLGSRAWPVVLDRRTGRLRPREPGAWVGTAHGLRPSVRGGAALNDLEIPRVYHWGPRSYSGSGATGTFSLNGAYTYGVGGPSVGYRHPIRTDRTLVAFYWYVHSITGSPADLNVEHRTGDATKPGTTLVGSVTTGAPVAGWNKAVFSPGLSLTSGDTHWTVVADANGSTTDYAVIRLGEAVSALYYPEYVLWTLKTSSNGWTTSGSTDAGRRFAAVWEYATGDVAGWAWASAGPTVASYSLGGARITWPDTVRLWGAMAPVPSVQISNFRLYAGAPASGFRAESTTTWGDETATNAAFLFSAPVEVTRGVTEYAVFSVSSTTTARAMGLGTTNGHEAVLRKTKDWFAQGVSWVQAPDGAATAWTENPDLSPSMYLLLEDFPPPPSGGGGGLARIIGG